MPNCENCYHFHMCDLQYRLEEHQDCKHYKDKSLIVELPCKVGDTVYKVIERCNLSSHICVFNGGYGSPRCCVKPCGAYIEEINFSINMIDLVGKSIFLNRKEAERILKGK